MENDFKLKSCSYRGRNIMIQTLSASFQVPVVSILVWGFTPGHVQVGWTVGEVDELQQDSHAKKHAWLVSEVDRDSGKEAPSHGSAPPDPEGAAPSGPPRAEAGNNSLEMEQIMSMLIQELWDIKSQLSRFSADTTAQLDVLGCSMGSSSGCRLCGQQQLTEGSCVRHQFSCDLSDEESQVPRPWE
ncbi:hypothetical protein BDN67DRAFT_984240 [Paxillus ammoniavirescens]|nr:hypothetical protein BDN67DRAFT_984240 [Paxillus ammoniavirescens]